MANVRWRNNKFQVQVRKNGYFVSWIFSLLSDRSGRSVNPAEHRSALPGGFRLLWYEIDKVLGQGGFGITYLAHDSNLDQPVAIKEYLPTQLRLRVGVEVHPLSEGRQSESLIWHGWCFECNAGHALNHATRMGTAIEPIF